MTDAIYYPKELGDILDRTFDRCFERIYAGDETSVAFLVTMEDDDQIVDQRIAVELDDGRLKPLTGQLESHKLAIKIYAIGFPGLLYQQDAVIVEVGERGNDESFLLAQAYQVVEKPRKEIRMLGGVQFLGVEGSRLE